MDKRNLRKRRISFRRKALIYYSNFKLSVIVTLLIFAGLFFLTNILNSFKSDLRVKFYKFSSEAGLVLENVAIGNLKNITKNEIEEALHATKGKPIFAIDLAGVKKELEENKWVESAMVARKLPNTIIVAVKERTPIAIWQFEGKLYLVDSDGNRITAYQGQKFDNLIQVVGNDANIYAQNLIDELNKYPALAARVKSAVRFGQRRWNLNFNDNFTAKMPENNFAAAYHYLATLNKNNKLFGNNYKILDLRDIDKYYFERH